MTYSISKLAAMFGLSRSTLLYYDRKGLLSPSGRTGNNYRIYSQQDLERLQKITIWRDAGLSLEDIKKLLEHKDDSQTKRLLEAQVQQLNEEIRKLRKQQRATLALLKSEDTEPDSRSMDKQQWVKLLASSGMSDEDMWQWHQEFERLMPLAHQDFLESLNIAEQEIIEIRRKSRGNSRRKY